MPGNGDLDVRVTRLEREARVWRAAAVLSMLLATVGRLAPSVSAQTQPQTINLDTIVARQIFVRGAGGSITLTADATNGASVVVNGQTTASLALFGQAGLGVTAPATDKYGAVDTYDASKAVAEMGLAPNMPGAFRVYDNIANIEPAWSAP